MKKILMALLAALMLGGNTVMAMSQQEAQDECRAQAADEEVSADEMDDYIKECVASIVGDEGESEKSE